MIIYAATQILYQKGGLTTIKFAFSVSKIPAASVPLIDFTEDLSWEDIYGSPVRNSRSLNNTGMSVHCVKN